MNSIKLSKVESLVTLGRCVIDPLAGLARLYAEGGEMVSIHIPWSRRETVVLTGAQAIERTLKDTDDFRTSGVGVHGPPGSAQKRLRLGLVRANGHEHRNLRKAYASYFERVSFVDLPSRILPLVEDEVRCWPADRFVDLTVLVSRLIRRMTIAAMFPEGDPYSSMRLSEIIEIHGHASFARSVMAFPHNLPGTPYRRVLTMAEGVERAIIDWANAYPKGGDDPNLVDTVHDAVGCQRGAADPRVAAQIWTLLGAGFDTSISTLVWTLYLLVQHPDWARRTREAAASVLGAPEPDVNALLGLRELEFVIRESMRVLTPVPLQKRVSLREVEICGQQFGPNTNFILSAFVTNRLPELYPQPAAFRPERFETINPTPFQLLTFSAGPRRCLGYWMAMAMLKTALAVILIRRKPELLPDQRIDATISCVFLRPSSSFLFRMAPHGGRPAAPVKLRGSLAKLVDIPM